MAWINKEEVSAKRAAIQACLKRFGLKGSISGSNSSTLTVNITEGKLAFSSMFNGRVNDEIVGDNFSVSPHWIDLRWNGEANYFFKQMFAIMNEGNHDNSDIHTDYFDVGWYSYINVGKWNKPYQLIK